MNILIKMWERIRALFKKRSPFLLTEAVKARVSPMELHIYKVDADRNGKMLEDWVRETLNKGVSRQTIDHLKRGSSVRQDALDEVYNMLDYSDSEFGDITVPPQKKVKNMTNKISGHPCRFLNPEIPPNYTSSECQGTCTSSVSGFGGKVCYWGSLVARQCGSFEPKLVSPSRLPVKPVDNT